MKFIAKVLFVFCLAFSFADARESAGALQDRIYSVCTSLKSSVVKVCAKKKITLKNENGETRILETLDVGTGFVIGRDGVVMTSSLITEGSEKIWLDFSGAIVEAESVGFDPLTTLSIVRAKGDFNVHNIRIVTIDGASVPPQTGALLLSLSREMGLSATPRLGLTAGHNIEFGGNFLPTVYLRTTIPAPRGATGGAVFDLNGKFVGITIASLPEFAGSFVLPARAAAKIRDDILNCGAPSYSWFGLRAEDIVAASGTKIVVTLVAENSPAKRGGFVVGDEILEINSRKVFNNSELRDITFFIRPAERALFKVKRGGKLLNLEVEADVMSPEILGAAGEKLSKDKTLKVEKASKNNLTDVKVPKK